MVTEADLHHLRRSIELAAKALQHGNPPFGSVLVDVAGTVLTEDYNQVRTGGKLHHPEISVARWAASHLTPDQRAAATVYTSGEHCAMCAAAHGWAGLGRIVYAVSCAQLADWLAEWDIPRGHVRDLPITAVLSNIDVEGPVAELVPLVRQLQQQFFHPGHSAAH